jgi:uncharacterized protein
METLKIEAIANDPDYALITGASGGIGYELVTLMASKGHNMILVARSEQRLKEIATDLIKKYNIKIIPLTSDLAKEGERMKLVNYIRENNLKINILVNNAGFGDAGYFADADWEKNEKMIQLNITALTHLTRAFLPEMINRKEGRILNVASLAGYLPGPLMSVYYATKSFVVSFSNALHSELRGTGVTVTTLSPGPVETNFFTEAGAADAKVNKLMKPATAQSVARFGYNRMMKGKRKAVQGLSAKFMLLGLRFVPSFITNYLLKRLHR